jgi:hypothetical protein
VAGKAEPHPLEKKCRKQGNAAAGGGVTAAGLMLKGVGIANPAAGLAGTLIGAAGTAKRMKRMSDCAPYVTRKDAQGRTYKQQHDDATRRANQGGYVHPAREEAPTRVAHAKKRAENAAEHDKWTRHYEACRHRLAVSWDRRDPNTSYDEAKNHKSTKFACRGVAEGELKNGR